MRQALAIAVAVALLAASVVDIVAAGVKAGSARSRPNYAAPTNVTVAVPDAMKNFTPDLLPQ
ncbi:MAG TPA: hypothetical protein VH558_13335 [Pseudolabrys sp.]|jgi:hypothetical protein